MKLLPYPQALSSLGQILFKGQDLLPLSEAKMRSVRGDDISIIFQEPQTSLNPLHTIERADRRDRSPCIAGSSARRRARA